MGLCTHVECYSNYVQVGPSQGWQCPLCRVVHAPHIEKCKCQIKNFRVIDGELCRILDESPPGSKPLPADAGILKARDRKE